MTDHEWNHWIEPYDLFISYSRSDNPESSPMVSTVVDQIKADFAEFSPSVPLNVFFDKTSIPDMSLWQDKLRKGLRQSKVMLAFLSEAYFLSEWCRREWEEYILVEQARTYPGESLSPIFVIAPDELEKLIPTPARAWWDDLMARNAVVEIHPFWNQGRDALQEILVRKRLLVLRDSIHLRVEFGRRLAEVPRNLSLRNPNFVGRDADLASIRERLREHEQVSLCAVHGIGGIGKSALAREYAYRFRPEYLGGQFEVDLSTTRDIAGILGSLVILARDKLKADIPTTLPEAEQFQRARAAFESQPPSKKILLIFDNLNEDATSLVGRSTIGQLPSPERVHLLFTTRADPRSLGGMQTITLDTLSTRDALELLFRYRQYARDHDDPEYQRVLEEQYDPARLAETPPDAEWKAALAIVNRLGRHTLAVTLVGAYLGIDRDLTYTRFHEQMTRRGIGLALEHVGNVQEVRNLVEHPAPLIGQLFEGSLGCLGKLALRTLEYAAFLPADHIPIAWLERIVKQDPEMAPELEETFGSPPWEQALAELEGLQYLVGQPYARMHRVVQEVVRSRLAEADREARSTALWQDLDTRTGRIHDTSGRYADPRELTALEAMVRAARDSTQGLAGRTAMSLVPTLQNLGRTRVAIELARLAERILSRVVAADPDSAEKRRDLSVSYNKLGNVSVASGDLDAARGYFERGLAIAERLAADDPGSAEKRRDLSVSYDRLGDVSVASGDLDAARGYFERGLEIAERLAADDPGSAQKRRDLSISYNKLGEVSVASGDLDAARGYFERGLEIRERLAADDPGSAEKRRDLSVSYDRLGDVSVASGDLGAARGYFERGLEIRERLAADDPGSAQKRRDLSVSYNKLGEVSVASGDLGAARGYFERDLAIAERLAADDPGSAQKRRDLSISYERLGDVSVVSGDLGAARGYFERGLAIRERLAADDPGSAQKRRDLCISHVKIAGLLERLQEPEAMDHWRAAHDILDGMRQRGLHLSPGDRGYLRWLKGKLGLAADPED